MQYTKLIFLIVLFVSLLGCYESITIPIGAEQTRESQRDILVGQLIGHPPETVVKEWGYPVKHFNLQNQQFMLYMTTHNNYEVDIPWVIIPFPIPQNKRATGPMFFRCIMIEIDSDGLVSKYSIQDADRRHYHKEDQIHECLTPFFDERELKHIVNISPKFKTPPPNTVTHVPGTPVCVADEEALRAIERAWDQEGKTLEVLDLLDQAEAAAGPPECDSVRAKILADKAYQVILESNP